jgi:hypothetical protein
MGMKVPAIVEETKKALEAGYCVVIGLQTTGEVLDLLVFNANFSSISAISWREKILQINFHFYQTSK